MFLHFSLRKTSVYRIINAPVRLYGIDMMMRNQPEIKMWNRIIETKFLRQVQGYKRLDLY